jgi:hypothetical protein
LLYRVHQRFQQATAVQAQHLQFLAHRFNMRVEVVVALIQQLVD